MRWIAVTVFVLIAVACATSPTGRSQLRLVSDAQIAQMGATAFAALQQKTPQASNAKISRYVGCVADAITRTVAPGQQWEVLVFENKEVNAFALPGGKIGVYTGLLKVTENRDQLAAVIGHEVAHVIAGHSAARVSNDLAANLGASVLGSTTGIDPQLIGVGANLLLLLPYSRGDESEADVLGLQYMAQAGFDPREAPKLWVNMSRQGGAAPPQILSSHPSNDTRIRDLESRVPQALPLYEQARARGLEPKCG
ncbi:MAG: M48 family metallopeptidase [Pseudomonadota bacterium]|nr:M48 family metallopeptidase [Pseudomonadota bacterium]